MIQWEEHKPKWWIAANDGKPRASFRFETDEIHARRYDTDKKHYNVGVWNSWIMTIDRTKHLTWPDGTPIDVMKAYVESHDTRLSGTSENKEMGL